MSNLPDPITIVIADDHPVFRDGFKFMLEKQKEKKFILVGEAADGRELLELVERLRPDLVITDILMPVINGIEATKKIRENYPDINVLAVSMCEEESMIIDMFTAGAKGYLAKNASKEEIMKSLDIVYQNGIYYSNSTNKSLLATIINSRQSSSKHRKKISFTNQEIHIMKLVCKQKTNKEIASDLDLSVRTVEDYRYKIQDKTEATCAVGIALYALKNGLVKWEDI